ncbi:MAG: hypothetical protein KF744_09135 [Taibaiella sp.]|nr:hypothetical protein [Taibaiella sp.]
MGNVKNIMSKEERVALLAQRIELLFGFMAEMVQDIDLLEETERVTADRASFAASAAPIFGALGEDYRQHEMEAALRCKRSAAVLNMLRVLRDTEAERKVFYSEQANQKAAARNFMQMFR